MYDSYKDAVADIPDLRPAGKHFLIRSENPQFLTIGAPILHKNIKIGELEGFRLTSDQKAVLVESFVYDDFKNLINGKTRFFNLSGLQLSGGLEGLNLQVGSLQSILAGGIGSIIVPDGTVLPTTEPYLLYSSQQEAQLADKIELTVFLKENKGLKEGSAVKHKGIEIGKVTKLTFTENLQMVVGTVRVDRNTAPLFRAGTLMWVEQVEVGLSGVKNIETMLFGSYLNILQGKGPPSRSFILLPQPPQTEIADQNGLGIVLEAKHLGSLSVGSPVYYRQVQVGQVTGYELSPTFQKVYVYVSIYNQYSAIIRKNTRFWNVSGTEVKGGLFSGVTVSAASLEAVMRGGIALATPDNETTGSTVVSGSHFTLFDKPEEEWLDWNPDIILLEQEQAPSSFQKS